MTRSVDCLEEGKLVDDARCEEEPKPESTQSCQSKECIGVWVLGEWSQVGLENYFKNVALIKSSVELQYMYTMIQPISLRRLNKICIKNI
jgi:hypothetical protein